MILDTPPHFDLDTTARASWQGGLWPVCYDRTARLLKLPLRLGPGEVQVKLHQAPAGPLEVTGLPEGGAQALVPQIFAALRLDEDLSLLYALTDRDPELGWARGRGAGRRLRSPTAFADLVKALLIGRGGRALGQAVLRRLHEAFPGFPGPAELAAAPPSFYEGDLGAGRLARPLRALALRCHDSLHAEALRRGAVAPQVAAAGDPAVLRELLAQEIEWAERVEALLLSLPGFGLRATDLMLPLLGCYEGLLYLPRLQAAWRRRTGGGRPAPGVAVDRQIGRQIDARVGRFGPYRGLAFQLLLEN